MCKEVKEVMQNHIQFVSFMELNESEKQDVNRLQPIVAEDMISGASSEITIQTISMLKVSDKTKLVLMSLVKRLNTLRGYDVDIAA